MTPTPFRAIVTAALGQPKLRPPKGRPGLGGLEKPKPVPGLGDFGKPKKSAAAMIASHIRAGKIKV